MDAHDKGAVLIACGLPTKLRGLLQLMLFTLAPIGSDEFTATMATIAAAAGVSASTARRYLAELVAQCFVVITNNGAPPPAGGRFCHRPNSYRLVPNAERARWRAAMAGALCCQIDAVDSPEERKIPSAGTGASTEREAARAKWLPELPGGQEGSLPTNTHPAECVEILAPSEPIGTDPAPIGSRLGGLLRVGVSCGIDATHTNSTFTSDNSGFGTEPPKEAHMADRSVPDRLTARERFVDRLFPAPEQVGHKSDLRSEHPGKREQKERTEPMARWNHPVCDPCSMPLRGTHVLIRGAPGGRVQFCGWCAQRTESGLTVRCDPAGVPYPDNPADARCYVARFRHTALAGVATIAGPRGPIRLDRMSDSEAVYAAGQFHQMARNVGRIARQRAAAPPPARRLGLS